MKTLKLFLLICITVTGFTTCKKYPEGGWSNVAIKHLFGGNHDNATKTWKLKLYEVNGIDSTGFITAGNGFTNFQNDAVLFTIKTRKGNDYKSTSLVYEYRIDLSKTDHKTLIFTGGSLDVVSNSQCYKSVCERNIFNPSFLANPYMIWKILKLKSDELILSGNNNGFSYKLILKN